jgi:hypothetical protein
LRTHLEPLPVSIAFYAPNCSVDISIGYDAFPRAVRSNLHINTQKKFYFSELLHDEETGKG